MRKTITALAALLVWSLIVLVSPPPFRRELAFAQNTTSLQYISPLPGSTLITPGTSIALRQGEPIAPDTVRPDLFHVTGSSSGLHPGSAVLSDDQKTLVFKPQQPFALGETVQVVVDQGILTTSGLPLDRVSFDFTISPRQAPLPPLVPTSASGSRPAALIPTPPAPAPPLRPTTLPPDLPAYTVNTAADVADDGDLFIASFQFPQGANNYLMILDPSGQLVYYKKTEHMVADFKRQPNGLLTYYEDGTFYVMDNTYRVVDSLTAGNGYIADLHDLQLLPNGHSLLMIYDAQYVDMSQIAQGGNPDAIVTGLVLQELDASKNVIFQWRSWDHFQITDSYEDLTKPTVDYVHGNSVELDGDGNILLSTRHLSEVTKINRQTGDVFWRWGGKNNQFTFVNDIDNPPFHYQHDVRRLPNGDISLFDNRTALTPSYSGAKQYRLDETTKTATLVWHYRHAPDVYALAMGNVQSLPNGNRVIGWGTAGIVTELNPRGNTVFELSLSAPNTSYRAFRYPWRAIPQDPPTLIAQNDSMAVTLIYSWNGATDAAYYQIYAGQVPDAMQLLATQSRAGFDTQTVLPYDPAHCLYYRVRPVDAQGNAMAFSNTVTTCH